MSIQFNNPNTNKGLVQLYEREINVDKGYVANDSERLKDFTADVNIAWDEFMRVASESAGTWQFDDSNHEDFPIIYLNLVSGQQDYTFTTDGSGNLVLDYMKVGILQSATDTEYEEIVPVDQQTTDVSIFEEDTAGGVPYKYDKTGNGVFLYPTPDYNATKGLKLVVNREAVYFTSEDTTKTPGVPGTLQDWFFRLPALEEKRRKKIISYAEYKDEKELLKQPIKEFFSSREKDNRYIMTPKKILYI